MKIYFVMWSTGLAGGTRAIFEIANRLKNRGYDVRVIALGGNHEWFDVTVPIEYVSPSKRLKILLQFYRVLRLRKKVYGVLAVESIVKRLGFHADLIRMLSEHIPDADAHIATYYPTALSLHLTNTASHKLYFLQDFPELVEEGGGRYGLRLFELTLKLPFNAFLCVSSYVKDLVTKAQPDARVVVTGVGVDTSIFRPRDNDVVNTMNKRKIMIIARGLKYKGDEVAIKALNIISSKIPTHAIIVGRRSTIKKLFQRVKPEFTYSIFENVSDDMLAKLYSSADVFLFTSYAEGFGLLPLEAMACGTPAVTTDCKGNRDYVRDGYNSLVVPPGDPKAVADAAFKVLTNDKLREKLIEGGLETARQWTWDKTVDRFEKTLKILES